MLFILHLEKIDWYFFFFYGPQQAQLFSDSQIKSLNDHSKYIYIYIILYSVHSVCTQMFMGSQYSSPCLIISEWIRVMREGSSRWSVSDLIREKKRGFKNRSWDDKVTAFARRRSEVHESVVSFRFGRICSCYFAVTQSSTPSRAESKPALPDSPFFFSFFFFFFPFFFFFSPPFVDFAIALPLSFLLCRNLKSNSREMDDIYLSFVSFIAIID